MAPAQVVAILASALMVIDQAAYSLALAFGAFSEIGRASCRERV